MASHNAELWRCPNCGREFAKRNQAHSCLVQTVDYHFRGKDPQLKQTYDLLITRLGEFGPLRIDTVKSSINFVSKYHFATVSVRRDHLRLAFVSDEIIEDERIHRTQRLGPQNVGHFVKLSSPSEADDRLVDWLGKAYTLQS